MSQTVIGERQPELLNGSRPDRARVPGSLENHPEHEHAGARDDAEALAG